MALGLYGSTMHEFILIELELGTRVAKAQDAEDCRMGVWVDISYLEWARKQDADEQMRLYWASVEL